MIWKKTFHRILKKQNQQRNLKKFKIKKKLVYSTVILVITTIINCNVFFSFLEVIIFIFNHFNVSTSALSQFFSGSIAVIDLPPSILKPTAPQSSANRGSSTELFYVVKNDCHLVMKSLMVIFYIYQAGFPVKAFFSLETWISVNWHHHIASFYET